ncbi:hypothetical protein FHS43_001835 [Streptosporangium becharense]|uniref:Uncharacterized protein n=1 Tax=Streptosporangium becharense TaxID=1816182 RepID=A0A7W9MJQ8_9ACTN|nr:hypothetical protein [Streptosporangium becharense]MBB2910572.1 hypothetical protein [Streptosporangium becharense]MBB5823315.1 hypothetical protein [Streptosporangium becharense]
MTSSRAGVIRPRGASVPPAAAVGRRPGARAARGRFDAVLRRAPRERAGTAR